MTRLAFLINSFEGGGAERAMSNLLHHMKSALTDYDVHLILLDDQPREQPVPDYVTLHVLDGRFSLARSARQLFGLLRTLKPDVCVSYLARANCLNVWGSWLFRYRPIISERVQTSSHLSTARNKSLLRALTRWSYPFAEAVIPVSQGVADDLAESFAVQRSKMHIIGNPVDAGKLRERAAEEPAIPLPDTYIVAAGRLVVNKNFPMLIKAYAEANPAADLVILGEGPDRADLEALVEKHGLTGRVHMPGFIRNPYPIMGRASVYVSSSNAEGFPNTLIEAMCLGRPVIATDCPSGPFEVLEGVRGAEKDPLQSARHGMLVPVNDAGVLAKAISAMMDPNTREDYAARAETRARHYRVETVVDAYSRLVA